MALATFALKSDQEVSAHLSMIFLSDFAHFLEVGRDFPLLVDLLDQFVALSPRLIDIVAELLNQVAHLFLIG